MRGELKPIGDDEPVRTFYDLQSSADPNGLHLLSVRVQRVQTNKKGEVETQDAYIVQNMKIDAESCELIRQIASGPPTENPAA